LIGHQKVENKNKKMYLSRFIRGSVVMLHFVSFPDIKETSELSYYVFIKNGREVSREGYRVGSGQDENHFSRNSKV
jgi:hypothetical protein